MDRVFARDNLYGYGNKLTAQLSVYSLVAIAALKVAERWTPLQLPRISRLILLPVAIPLLRLAFIKQDQRSFQPLKDSEVTRIVSALEPQKKKKKKGAETPQPKDKEIEHALQTLERKPLTLEIRKQIWHLQLHVFKQQKTNVLSETAYRRFCSYPSELLRTSQNSQTLDKFINQSNTHEIVKTQPRLKKWVDRASERKTEVKEQKKSRQKYQRKHRWEKMKNFFNPKKAWKKTKDAVAVAWAATVLKAFFK